MHLDIALAYLHRGERGPWCTLIFFVYFQFSVPSSQDNYQCSELSVIPLSYPGALDHFSISRVGTLFCNCLFPIQSVIISDPNPWSELSVSGCSLAELKRRQNAFFKIQLKSVGSI